jgi:Na+/H+ antiporter NhaD/arsenite permease-like protein
VLKVPLTNNQREMFGDKLLELANLTFGGMVVGQFISGQPFSFPLALAGLILLVILYVISYTVTKKRGK